jgi:hypothetical protein
MPAQDDIFVINGFYSVMATKYTEPGASIYYFSVEWDAAATSWADFRSEVLGATDPGLASTTSMRSRIMRDWQSLGLTAAPGISANGVHGSASPFEGLVERMNWLGARLDEDATARAMIAAGVSKEKIRAWAKDPQVWVRRCQPRCQPQSPAQLTRRARFTPIPTMILPGGRWRRPHGFCLRLLRGYVGALLRPSLVAGVS